MNHGGILPAWLFANVHNRRNLGNQQSQNTTR